MTLQNINAKYETGIVTESEKIMPEESSVAGAKRIYGNLRKILELARNQGEITRNDVESLLRVSASTASRILRRMVKNNALEKYGKARSTKYTLTE